MLVFVVGVLGTTHAGAREPSPPQDPAPAEEPARPSGPVAPEGDAPDTSAPAEAAEQAEEPAQDEPPQPPVDPAPQSPKPAPASPAGKGPIPQDALSDLDLDLVALMGTEVKVVTATKTAQALDDAPAIIEVVTAEDIRRWGYRNVAEVLSHVAGFYVLDDHVLPNVSVRGVAGGLMSESSMIKVMIDGQPVAFRTTAGNWLGPELIPLSVISRIEIIRGPASALYGADAFLGVVNIITKTGKEVGGLGGNVAAKTLNSRLSDGNFVDRHLGSDVDLVAGERWGKFDVLVAFGRESQDRWGLRLPATSPAPRIPDYSSDRDYSTRLLHRGTSLYTKFRYSPGKERVQIFGGYAQSWIQRGGDFAHWAQLTAGVDDLGRSNGTVVSLQQRRAELGANIIAHEKVSVRVNTDYHDGNPRAGDRIEVASESFYRKRNFGYHGFLAGAEVVYTPAPKLQFVTGTQLNYDVHELRAPSRVDKTTGEVYADGQDADAKRRLVNPGAYLQANWLAFDPYARLTAGVRYDWHNIYGSQVAGRGGIVSHFGKQRRLTTKLLYGSAFKAPSPLLLFATPLRPGDIIGNRALAPMLVHTFEGQLAWSPLKEIRLTSGVTYSLLLNKAEFRPQGINITAQNLSRQRGLSWETRADFSHKKWLKGYASFDLQQAVRSIDRVGYVATLIGTKNVVHPLWIARAGFDFNVEKARIALMTEAMIVGKRRATDTNIAENGRDYYLPAYPMLNAGIRTHDLDLFGKGFTRFSVYAYNLINNTTPDPGFAGYDYPRLPLEVMLKITHFHR